MNREFLLDDREVKEKVYELLLDDKKPAATEILCEAAKEKYFLYTTRDDEKSEVWVYSEGIYIPQGKTFVKEYCRKILSTAYTTFLCNQVISKIEADTFIDANTFFSNNIVNEIAVQNGVLNITTKELTDFTPDKVFFNKIPVKYDSSVLCPAIEQHFKTVLKSEDDAHVLFELFGYLLLKEYRIEKAIMFVGDGRNGKGKTLDLMKRFIGVENCSSVPLQQFETDLYAPGELFQKLANLPGDLDAKSLRHTGTLKNLTGRDLIAAPRKFLPRVNFVNYAKMIFACNKLPRTYDTTTAFWNRWVLFEFPFTFLSQEEIDKMPEKERGTVKLRDPDIIATLATPEELTGLLNKALDGLQRLLAQKDFTNSKGVAEIKDMWIKKSDSFLSFCLDSLVGDFDCALAKSEIRKEYSLFCKKHKVSMMSEKACGLTLQENFAIWEERKDNGMYWAGIRLKVKEPSKDEGNLNIM